MTATAGPTKPQIAPPTGDSQQLPLRKKRLTTVKCDRHESQLLRSRPF